jgi:hypothetical protein
LSFQKEFLVKLFLRGGLFIVLSTFGKKIYDRIQKKNKRMMVTADLLYENKTYPATIKISEAIHEIIAEGLITIKSVVNHGRFETELIPKDGYIQHKAEKALKRSSENSENKPKRKYQRRNVRRGAL